MADAAESEKLTLWAAIKDLGWFPMLLIGLGGFSILAILEQAVFRRPFELVQIFQWPLDAYYRLSRLVGAIVEPLIQPAINWLNSNFFAELALNPAWRSVFLLSQMQTMSHIRAYMKTYPRRRIILFFMAQSISSIIISISLTSLVNQGSIVAICLFYFIFSIVIVLASFASFRSAKLRDERVMISRHLRFSLAMLGGLVAAGLILAADWGLKALGAG